jgi:hypothetical protein
LLLRRFNVVVGCCLKGRCVRLSGLVVWKGEWEEGGLGGIKGAKARAIGAGCTRAFAGGKR